MARTFGNPIPQVPATDRLGGEETGAWHNGIFFRALVDLGTGDVAGFEPLLARAVWPEALVPPGPDRLVERFEASRPGTAGPSPAGARAAAAYLVRGDLTTRPAHIGATLGVSPARAIVMFDVAELCQDPARSLDLLLACKRTGARILLDNFDLDDPPARFMELLPADILRVAPRRMPWHWEEARRRAVLASVLEFAGNLLMDVAVEGVHGGGERIKYRRLGVRYAQGGWCRDISGLMPDSLRS